MRPVPQALTSAESYFPDDAARQFRGACLDALFNYSAKVLRDDVRSPPDAAIDFGTSGALVLYLDHRLN